MKNKKIQDLKFTRKTNASIIAVKIIRWRKVLDSSIAAICEDIMECRPTIEVSEK